MKHKLLNQIEKELILSIWYKYIYNKNKINQNYFNVGELIKINFSYKYKSLDYKKSFIGLCIKKKYNKYMMGIKVIFLISNYKIVYDTLVTNPLLKNIEFLSKKKIWYKKSYFRNSKLYFLKFLKTKNLIKKLL